MKDNNPKAGSSRWLRRIFFVLFVVVTSGGYFAFDDYLRQFWADKPWEQRNASYRIKDDTSATIAKRFVIGGTCGAILATLIVIQGMQRKKRDDDAAS
jgi:hypothetical protein